MTRVGTRRRWLAAAVVAATTTALVLPLAGPAQAAGRSPARDGADVRSAPQSVQDGSFTKFQSPSTAAKKAARAQAGAAPAARAAADAGSPPVGTVKTWLALDDVEGYYTKSFVLKGVGKHIEIWVASDADGNEQLGFPSGSVGACRNDVFDGGEIDVTQDQVDSFVHEFDSNMYPKESKVFSVAKSRDGSDLQPVFGAPFNEILGVPADYWAGDGDKVVTLVDNVRDANYYDPSTPDGQTYIAGFFSPTYSQTFDRNMMNIDAYDWLHRTGANPPDDTNSDELSGCSYANGQPRPRLYEGTFAHEYQHLLENDVDGDEVSWVNEGLSDYAQTLVGYVNTSIRYPRVGADSHIACFQGVLGDSYGGPENSLTGWEDQGGPEVLCDYGAAYSFMTYLASRLGTKAITALHKEPGNGLVGLQEVLDANHTTENAIDMVHEWNAMMALNDVLDRGATLKGASPAIYSSARLHSRINLSTTQAYGTAGAPANGADYVQTRNQYGNDLPARQISSISFAGAPSLTPDPLAWTVDADAHGGDAALYSGTGDGLDRAAVTKVSVPSGSPTLTFDTKYDTESTWDFAVVQVSTDGGKTYTSLPVAGTTSEHDAAADPTIVAQLPGFTGSSDGWVSKSVDMSAYAGQDVLVSFRYLTDAATHEDGFWVDNVAVGGTVVSDGSSLAGFSSATQISPIPVDGWTVQVIGYTNDGTKAYYTTLKVNAGFRGSLSASDIASRLGRADVVAVLVTQDDPDETATKYARYTLRVNGVLQPGG